jgi:putative DNA primase/helicase
MQRIINDPMTAICQTGIIPADKINVLVDDKIHRFRVHGEKIGRLSGAYKISFTTDGQMVGWVKDFRHGSTVSIKPKFKLSPDAVAGFSKSKTDAQNRSREEKAAAALTAQKIVRQSSACASHPYADKKQIQVIGAITNGGCLIIPVYDPSDQIVNLQRILPDGSKRFLKGGRKLGCHGKIPPADGYGLNKIYVTEGWATGVSVRMATGCAVAVAFDASNLKNVVHHLKNKYPVSRIIIAADNDQWTILPNGNKYNAGLQNAVSSGAHAIAYPKFSADEDSKPTDWNDWMVLRGINGMGDLLNV